MTEHQGAETFVEDGAMKDIPGFSEEKQTIVDEGEINEAFEPANNALSGLRDAGDWIINWFSEVFGQLFGNIM
jgi:hypothetical protein